jgi:hypothetical protein
MQDVVEQLADSDLATLAERKLARADIRSPIAQRVVAQVPAARGTPTGSRCARRGGRLRPPSGDAGVPRPRRQSAQRARCTTASNG